MEQPSRRNKFIKTYFNDAYNQFYLSKEILDKLFDDHNNPCKDLMNALKYTEEREPVTYLAKILRQHNQAHVAKVLEEFNKSEAFIDYVSTEFLQVRHTEVLRSGGSCRFEMETSPRGFCLIIVNENQLEMEAKQLASVFSQMYFTVRTERKKTSTQIDKIFDEVATNDKYDGYNALLIIMIGHGYDGYFEGSAIKRDPKDVIPIVHLIDKFSEDKRCTRNGVEVAVNFCGKPKIHIFNCCRIRLNSDDMDSTLHQRIQCFKKDWVNNNINTTVIYSCAQGQEAFYSPTTGFSFFGRALSHTIAQFACEQNLDELIKTINKRLEKDLSETEIKEKQFPEVIHYKGRWHLYFNPGRIKIN